MSLMQRSKGKAGEREAAALVRELTGWDVQRRVRQHDGDSDLQGVPGWSVEVKRHRTATRGDLTRWWAQTVAQAGDLLPVLLYRVDPRRLACRVAAGRRAAGEPDCRLLDRRHHAAGQGRCGARRAGRRRRTLYRLPPPTT